MNIIRRGVITFALFGAFAWLSALLGFNPLVTYQGQKIAAVYEPDSFHPLTLYTLIASVFIALLARVIFKLILALRHGRRA